MLKRGFTIGIFILTVTGFLFSCTKDLNESVDELARKSFDAWMAKNAPEAVAYGDIYIDFVERGPAGAAQPAYGLSYIETNYTGRNLDGQIFVTRSEETSRLLGRFAYTTHYCDDFSQYVPSSYKFCAGAKEALDLMRVGDSVRVYIPANKGYTSRMSVNTGYSGEYYASYIGRPIIFDIRLNRVVNEPYLWERDSVERAAKRLWGDDYIQDTVGLFLRILESNPEGDPITEDSSVLVFFEQYFMDGFLALTNIDTVAKKHNVYTTDNDDDGLYTGQYIRRKTLDSGGEDVELAVLYLTIPHMRKGEVAEVVTMSTWVFGNAGASGMTPEILPYQPMYFKIYTMEDEEEDEDED